MELNTSEKRSKRGETIGRGLRHLKINKTKKQLFFVRSLVYNMSDLSCATGNIKVSAGIVCKIVEALIVVCILKKQTK